MAGDLARGMAAALLAAAMYGSAPAVQAVQARRERAGRGVGAGLLLRLTRRPLWLLGLGAEIVGFVVEAYAFSVAPATVVAPLTACDLFFFVFVAALVLRDRPSRLALVGVATMAVGVGLLALAFGGSAELGEPASNAQLLVFLAAAVAVSAACGVAGTRAGRAVVAAGFFSAAAGVAYGLATLATRQVGRTFSPQHPFHLLTTATPYVLAACSLLAMGLLQRGLQTSPLLTFPVMSATAALLPALLGAAVLGDPVPSGAGLVAFVAALVALVLGVTVLGRDRARAEQP